MVASGITHTQQQTFLDLLSLSGTTENGKSLSYKFESEANTKLRRQVQSEIVELAEKEQQEQIQNLLESSDTEVAIQVDGCYLGCPRIKSKNLKTLNF